MSWCSSFRALPCLCHQHGIVFGGVAASAEDHLGHGLLCWDGCGTAAHVCGGARRGGGRAGMETVGQEGGRSDTLVGLGWCECLLSTSLRCNKASGCRCQLQDANP